MEQEVAISSNRVILKGNLIVPDNPVGAVLFAHGSGSGRFSPRNRAVAKFLNEHRFATVRAPTLLIVGGADDVVIELNQQAYKELNCVKRIAIVPGATHLFEEPGALETVATLAKDWFDQYLNPNASHDRKAV